VLGTGVVGAGVVGAGGAAGAVVVGAGGAAGAVVVAGRAGAGVGVAAGFGFGSCAVCANAVGACRRMASVAILSATPLIAPLRAFRMDCSYPAEPWRVFRMMKSTLSMRPPCERSRPCARGEPGKASCRGPLRCESLSLPPWAFPNARARVVGFTPLFCPTEKNLL